MLPPLASSRSLTHWITAFLAFVFSASVWAAEVNITRNQLPIVLGQYVDIYEDTTRAMGIEEILAADIPWRRSTQAIPTLGMSESAFWMYLEITSREAIDENLMLSVNSSIIDRLDFYFLRGDEVLDHTISGDTVPFSQIAQPYRIPVVPFYLAPVGETTRVFIRVESTSGIEFPLRLGTMGSIAIDQQYQLTFFGAFFSALAICFCICAAYYFNMKDREFLGYAMFFASSIPFFLTQSGMGRIWFWGESTQLNNRVAYLSAVGLIVSMSLLGQAMSLKIPYKHQVNFVLRYVSYLMIPAGLYFLLAPLDSITSETVLMMMILGFAMALSVCVISGITAAQGSRSALYLFCSWILILTAYLSMLAYRLTFTQRGDSSMIVAETLVILACAALLLSMFEYVRTRNDALNQFKLETEAKGDFLRNVSREFLTPVHLILANSKRLLAAQSNKLDEATRQHMNTVIKQSDHLHNLINDLLEMAELESDSFAPEFELVEMSHFLNEVRDMLLPLAMEKNLEFKTEYASANLLVQTDISRLQHALINIITNAIKFTDHGSIKLGYKAVYFRRRLGVEISVSDTGRGMSADFQKRMFKEFAREESMSEKDPQGTGLGMVIVRRMVERLGGEITFESTKGQGSQFFIRLPLRDQAA